MSRQFLYGSVIVGFLAVLVYFPMLSAGPVWDDIIVETVQMPHFRSVGDAFFPDLSVQEASPNFYRPFVLLSYMADRSIAKNLTGERDDALLSNPLPARPVQHGSNLFFHALTSVLVYLVAAEIFRGKSFRSAASLAAGVVFALHPIHAESVCAFTGRSDVMAAAGVLLAAWIVLRYGEEGRLRWSLLSAVAFLAALFSKEVGIAALGVAPLLVWGRGQGRENARGKGTSGGWVALGALWAAALVIYLGLRVAAGIAAPQSANGSGGLAVSRLVRAAGYYVQKAVIPWPQAHYVPEPPALVLSLAVLVLGCFGVWLLARIFVSHRRLIYALSAVFWVGLAPSLSVAVRPVAATPVAERYLYLPSAALAVLLGLLFGILSESRRIRRAAVALGILVSLALGISSYAQTSVWKSNLAFWEDVVRDDTAARYGMVLSNLGEAYQSAGQAEKAREVYRRALGPDVVMNDGEQRIVVRHNMGVMSMESAMDRLDAGNPQAALSDANEAIAVFEENRRFLPNEAIIYKALGRSYLVKAKALRAISGKKDAQMLLRADQALKTALTLDPQSRSARADFEESRALMSGD